MEGKMRQVVLAAPEKFEERQVEIPKAGEGQVLLKIKAVGICGSDLHTYYGKHPFVHTPIVLGHEASGEVVEVGDGVTKLNVGDRVVIRPQRTCGVCRPCRQGRYNVCEKLNVLGCLDTGASSEYFNVEESICYKLPETCSFAVGSVIEPLAVGVHAVRRGGGAKGKNVLVTGAGTIGNVVAQAALGAGAKNVIITDVSEFKLELARKCGIGHAVNVKEQDLGSYVDEVLGDGQLDLILECSAVEGVLNQAIDIAPKGINIVVVGVFEDKPRVDMAAVQDREYSLIGTLMYTHEDYVEAIRLVKEEKADLEDLITNTFSFSEYAQAYKFIEENRNVTQKVVITL